jgi:hypothetical protein
LAPEPLQRASIDYADALRSLRAAQQEMREATAAVKAAVASDEANTLEAAREGKASPVPKAAKARDQAERAAAEATALARVAQEAFGRFLDQLVAQREEFDRAAEDAVEETRRRVGPVVEEIEADLLRLYGLRSLRQELAEPGYLVARLPQFRPRQPSRLGEPLQGALKSIKDMLDEERIEAERIERFTERANVA